jgi:hypothetical protein
VHCEVGNLTQTVEVNTVQTQQVNAVIDSKQVDNLTMNGRNYVQLMTMVPGGFLQRPERSQLQRAEYHHQQRLRYGVERVSSTPDPVAAETRVLRSRDSGYRFGPASGSSIREPAFAFWVVARRKDPPETGLQGLSLEFLHFSTRFVLISALSCLVGVSLSILSTY